MFGALIFLLKIHNNLVCRDKKIFKNLQTQNINNNLENSNKKQNISSIVLSILYFKKVHWCFTNIFKKNGAVQTYILLCKQLRIV